MSRGGREGQMYSIGKRGGPSFSLCSAEVFIFHVSSSCGSRELAGKKLNERAQGCGNTHSDAMVCSLCKEAGHTKLKCPQKPAVPPTLAEVRAEKESRIPPEEVMATLDITEEDVGKLTVLTKICDDVAKALKKGRDEKTYQAAICQDLRAMGITCTPEVIVPILYKGLQVATERLDIELHDYLDFIFETKCTTSSIKPEHHWQVISYMTTQKKRFGAVVNYNQSASSVGVEIDIIIRNEGRNYLYNLQTGQATMLKDY